MDKPALAPDLIDQLHALDHATSRRLVCFLALYLGSAATACAIAARFPGSWAAVALAAPFYLIAAASLHGISLFTHEGVHGTLSRRPLVNRLAAAACAWPVLQNFAAYKILHLRHHNCLGRDGDPDHYANYTQWTTLQFLMHWGRLIAGYPAYIVAIPILGFRQGTNADRAWIAFEVSMVIGLGAAVLLSPLPTAGLVHGWLMPMLIINTLVNIRGMSQHTLLDHADDPVLGSRSILTNPATRFFMCNENYHLEHHLYPGVPWYNLGRLHAELRPQLEARGAPFIGSYASFVAEFIAISWRRLAGGTASK